MRGRRKNAIIKNKKRERKTHTPTIPKNTTRSTIVVDMVWCTGMVNMVPMYHRVPYYIQLQVQVPYKYGWLIEPAVLAISDSGELHS